MRSFHLPKCLFIFFPILAFSKDEYIGIDLKAMEGKSEVNYNPVVIEVENEEEPEENNTGSGETEEPAGTESGSESSE